MVTAWPDRPVGPAQPWVSGSGGLVVSLDPPCPVPGAPRGPETQGGSDGQEAGPVRGHRVHLHPDPEPGAQEGAPTKACLPTSEADLPRANLWLQCFWKLTEQISLTF